MDEELEPTHDDAIDTAEVQAIVCAPCEAALAERSDVIPGERYPVYANPAGVVFELVLVSTAPGTRAVSAPVLEHTWFAGYAWQIAVCSACLAHVGWHYVATGGQRPQHLVGLIADKVR